MTYDQITSLLGSPGKREGLPKLLLSWSQGGCYLQVMLDENKASGNQTWCDKVCKEIAGENWCKSDVTNPFSDKIKSKMTYQEIVNAVGEPNQEQEVLVYKWSGVDGTQKNEIMVYFADNLAFEVYKFSLEED